MLAYPRSRRAAVLLVLCLGTASLLLGAAPITVLSGKISTVDKTSKTITVVPQNPGKKQAFQISEATVIAIGQETGNLASLMTGQRVTVFYDPATRVISKLRVANTPKQEAANRVVMRPAFPEGPGITPIDGGNGRYKLDVRPAKTVQAVLDYEVKMPSVAANEWVVISPAPPELPSQTNVHSTLEPGGIPVQDLSSQHRPLLMARVPADGWERRYIVSSRAEYRATLMARHLVSRQPGEQGTEPFPLNAQERRAALARGETFDFDSPGFRKWLESQHLWKEPQEGQIDYARRVFLAIKRDFSYEFTGDMDRRASHICRAGRSDCGGLSIVFASAMRAQNIPARILVGRWAISAERGQKAAGAPYYQAHVKAEFYADGVGWVPVDLASAVLHDRSREGLRFFGRDEGNFLTLHLDPDLIVDSVFFGSKPIFCINGGLLVWVTGSGPAEPPKIRQNWNVHELPMTAHHVPFGSGF